MEVKIDHHANKVSSSSKGAYRYRIGGNVDDDVSAKGVCDPGTPLTEDEQVADLVVG